MNMKTNRKSGKIKPAEVKSFQTRYGLDVDGKFGHQSMGQLLVVEARLKTGPNWVTVNAASFIAFVTGYFFAWIW